MTDNETMIPAAVSGASEPAQPCNGSVRSATTQLLLYSIANEACSTMSCDCCSILLSEGTDLIIEATSGLDEETFPARRIPLGTGFSGTIAASRKIVSFPDVSLRLSELPGCLEPYYKGPFASTPLEFGGGLLGLLNVCRRNGGSEFSRVDLTHLADFGSRISVEIMYQIMIDKWTCEHNQLHMQLTTLNDRLRTDIEERTRTEERISKQNRELNETNRLLMKTGRDLRSSEENFRNLVECMNDGIFILTGGIIRYSNPAGMKMMGCRPGELEGGVFLDLIEDSARAGMESALSVCGTEPAQSSRLIESKMRGSSGRPMDVELNLGNTTYSREKAILVFFRDVTERNNLRQSLQQAQKLESIGQLAAGIAHEINTPMQYIMNNVQFFEEAFTAFKAEFDRMRENAEGASHEGGTAGVQSGSGSVDYSGDIGFFLEEIPNALKQAFDGVTRVVKIVRAMKEFSHPGSKTMAPADINKAIESTVTVARNEWKYVADLELDLDATMRPVPCMIGEFNQVILNIVINAAHAIADAVSDGKKGKIKIATKTLGEKAEIRISDTGTGIKPENKDSIFSPFFTTKLVGKGTGQGLAIARAIIADAHHGDLFFESQEGIGTTFVIRLPFRQPGGGE